MRLDRFTREMLREAVRLYLAEAYPESAPPQVVRDRLDWPEGETLASLASAEMFERSPPEALPSECDRIRLRLGNAAFPHMKLGVDRVPETDEWVLAVDCHDRALLSAASDEERAAVEDLVRRNAELKARIERRWNEAGLPTFKRFVRGRLRSAKGG